MGFGLRVKNPTSKLVTDFHFRHQVPDRSFSLTSLRAFLEWIRSKVCRNIAAICIGNQVAAPLKNHRGPVDYIYENHPLQGSLKQSSNWDVEEKTPLPPRYYPQNNWWTRHPSEGFSSSSSSTLGMQFVRSGELRWCNSTRFDQHPLRIWL